MSRVLRLLVLAALGVAVAMAAPSGAGAEFGIDEFEAGTCSENTEPTPPAGEGPGQCTFETPDRWYTQAAGHPNYGGIDFRLNTDAFGFPEGNLRHVRTDLPVGISVNPQAVPQCTVEQLEGPGCPSNTQVGTNYLTAAVAPSTTMTVPVNVYNMVPPHGKPQMAGMRLLIGELDLDHPVYFVGDAEWEGDYHQFFTISDVSDDVEIVRNRLIFDGRANHDGTGPSFIRMPTTCAGPQTTHLAVASYQDPETFVSISSTTPVGADGCENVPFGPEVTVETASSRTDSPSAVTVEVEIPDPPTDEIQPSDVRSTTISLPRGMSLNASSVEGLGTCTEAQFGKGTRNPIRCPASSRIGRAAIDTPVLPPGSLSGNVYVGQPLSDDPASGEQFRLFMEAGSERFGVSVRLIGDVTVHPRTGRLTTRLSGLPQAPFSTFTVRLDGGPRAVLSTPPTCGPHTTNARFVPWSGEGATRSASSFTLGRAPDGEECASSLAERPFSPDVMPEASNQTSGEYTRLRVGVSRSDGEQELKRLDLTLPAGMTARLAGIPYCPEQAIEAAGDKSASAELGSRSCPGSSRIGHVDLEAGSGPSPFGIRGQAYLAGPYGGAPLSMVVITPALAGPYDLGTVVVRAALHVHPVTLEVRALSDRIPHMVRGVSLGLRTIDVRITRPSFNLNPTGCWEKAFWGNLRGGGGNPANPARWSRSDFMTPYQAEACERLAFSPRMHMRLFGGPRQLMRSGHPALRAIVLSDPHAANIRRAVVRLPRSIQLDQANIRTVCTREQWANDECPRGSIYGFAAAKSPLLDTPLRGPVYLRSSDHQLPDMVASLRGQVNVELAGRIDAARGSIRNLFASVPDAPISGFLLRLRGGPRGLLVANRNLCQRRQVAASGWLAQNLEAQRLRTPMRMNCRWMRRR